MKVTAAHESTAVTTRRPLMDDFDRATGIGEEYP